MSPVLGSACTLFDTSQDKKTSLFFFWGGGGEEGHLSQ